MHYASDKLFAVKEAWDKPYKLIDLDGKVVVEGKYDEVAYFSDKLIMVGKEGKYGLIDFSERKCFL